MFLNTTWAYPGEGILMGVYLLIILLVVRCIWWYIRFNKGVFSLIMNLYIGSLLVRNTGFLSNNSAGLPFTFMYVDSPPKIFL